MTAPIEESLVQAISLVNDAFIHDRQYTNISKQLRVNFLHNQLTFSGLADNDYPYNPHMSQQDMSKGPLGLREISEIRYMPYPTVIGERLAEMKYNMSSGMFTSIKRSYIVIDNSFFIFNYLNDEFIEYSSMQGNITLVGLLKLKKNVFHDDFEKVLVLVTHEEVVFVGLEFDHALGTMKMLNEPIFHMDNTDSLLMTHMVCSDNGRLFMSASDGNIYEINYMAKKGYVFEYKMRINLTETYLSNLIPSFISGSSPQIVIMEMDESRQLLYTLNDVGRIDVYFIEETKFRHIGSMSKTMIENSVARVIQNISIKYGNIITLSPVDKSESHDIHLIAITSGGIRYYFTTEETGHVYRDSFGNPASPNLQFPGNYDNRDIGHASSRNDRQAPLVDPATLANIHGNLEHMMKCQPCKLALVHVRMPPGYSSQGQRNLKIIDAHIAHHSQGSMFLISKFEDREVLYTISSDNYPFTSCLQENFVAVECQGHSFSIVELDSRPIIPKDKYVEPMESLQSLPPMTIRQIREYPRNFLIISSKGVYSFQKLRPVDSLRYLISEYTIDSEFVKFYFHHRKEQACATSLQLSTNPVDEKQLSMAALHASILYGGSPQLNPNANESGAMQVILKPTPAINLSKQKNEVLKNHPVERVSFSDKIINKMSEMMKAALMPRSPAQENQFTLKVKHEQVTDIDVSNLPGAMKVTRSDSLVGAGDCKTPQNYGIMVNKNVLLSNRHRGMCLYISRLLKPFWNQTVLIPEMSGNNCLITSRYTVIEINWLLSKLVDLNMLLSNHMEIEKHSNQRTTYERESIPRQRAHSFETASLRQLQTLVVRVGEVLNMWLTLCDHHIYEIYNSLSQSGKDEFNTLTLQTLVLGGKPLSMRLLSVVIEMHVKNDTPTDKISENLCIHCPSLYNKSDAISSKANELIKYARGQNDVEKARMMQQSLKMFANIASEIDVRRICDQYAEVDFYSGIVHLCHMAAQARDPSHLADNFYTKHEPHDDIDGMKYYNIRQECYQPLLNQLDNLLNLVNTAKLKNPSEYAKQTPVIMADRNILLITDLVFSTRDELLHVSLFHWLIANKFESAIIKARSEYFEAFMLQSLKRQPDNSHLREILIEHYEHMNLCDRARDLLVDTAIQSRNKMKLSIRVQLLEQAVTSGENHIRNHHQEHQGSLADNEKREENLNYLKLAKLQEMILNMFLDKMTKTSDAEKQSEIQLIATGDLGFTLLPCDTLYMKYAVGYRLVEVELYLLHMCNSCDDATVIQLWGTLIDNVLQETCELPLEVQMERLSDMVIRVGKVLNNGDSSFLPLDEIICMLEVKSAQHLFYTLNHQLIPTIIMSIRNDFYNLLRIYLQIFNSKRALFSDLNKPFHLLSTMIFLCEEFIQRCNNDKIHAIDKPEMSTFVKVMLRTMMDSVEMSSDIEQYERDDLLHSLMSCMDGLSMIRSMNTSGLGLY